MCCEGVGAVHQSVTETKGWRRIHLRQYVPTRIYDKIPVDDKNYLTPIVIQPGALVEMKTERQKG